LKFYLWLWVSWCGLSTIKLQFALSKCQVMVECGISRKMDWTSRAGCMFSSAAGSNSSEFFPLRTLKGARYAVFWRIIEDLGVRLEAVVTTASARMLRCVRLEMEGQFERLL
jgi:hypothetical protein